MQDLPNLFDETMLGLKREAWLARLSEIAETHGFYQRLGRRHAACYIDEGDTLLVTFESIQGTQALSETGQPLGFDLVRSLGWSHLGVIADGDTWFRDPHVYAFFDDLGDESFFEQFEQVLFYGAGPCGYAAAAFSVAAPGATVLTIQPQATLETRMTEWDDRFTHMRRTSFVDRYGYAPDMLEAAAQAFVIYDPRERLDAMHAALFARPHVTRLRLPFMGGTLQTDLLNMQLLYPILARAGTGRLDTVSFARMLRARRNYRPYLFRLLAHLEAEGRSGLVRMLCENVVSRMAAPRFRQRLKKLAAQPRPEKGSGG